MLTLRKNTTMLLLGLAVLLFIGTAAGENQRAARRQPTRQEQRDEKQAQAAERRADNQAPRQENTQAVAEQRADRQVERQPQVTQKQAKSPARTEADKQPAVERRAEQQPVAAQQRTENQARIERPEVRRGQTAQRNRAADPQPAEKRPQQQQNEQVRVERQEVKREQPAQQRQATAPQLAEKQVQQQQNRQVRVERQEVKREQPAQQRQATAPQPAEKAVAENQNRRSITKNVNRDGNTRRVAEPRSAEVVKGSDVQRTATRAGRSSGRSSGQTVVRNTTVRFDRPRVVRPHREAYSRYSLGDKDGKSFDVRTYVSGRRPGRVFSHIVWPSYGYPVYYRHGPDLFVSYVRPAYLRKYIFVSIGGYWPGYCSSLRYSWYSWHPYTWYGCYPTAYEVGGDTYNYYTYNTYSYGSDASPSYTTSEYGGPLESVDETTFEDIRQKLAEQTQKKPEPETLTDKFFENGVTAFEQGDYETAAKAFADAIALEPNDLVLPFAYVQALFASEQYSKAADILRLALEQMPADQQGLFFPRGLYSDDEIFFAQIDQLRSRTGSFSYDPDLSLLLGYQLIGAEKYDEARNRLEQAAQYGLNQNAVTILVDLLNKLEEQTENVSENI